MRKLIVFLMLSALFTLHVIVLERTTGAGKSSSEEAMSFSLVLPSPILKIISLEFDQLAADYLFLKSMGLVGAYVAKRGTGPAPERIWDWLEDALTVATDIDPYFIDPYYYGNAYMTWDAGRIGEVNALLEKGSRARDWDWTFPFFIGFNYFYFLQKNDEASAYLMEASRRRDGDPILASIASRLAYKERRTETAIYFLEETLRTTDDAVTKKHFEKRIRALRAILALESAVAQFTEKYGKRPARIEELVSKNIISRLPTDPYGGTYYLADSGSVKSTASSDLEPYISPLQKKIRR